MATREPLSPFTTLQHLATMPVEGQLSPYESVRKVRDLITRGDIWTQEVILAITSTDIIIKDGSTRVSGA